MNGSAEKAKLTFNPPSSLEMMKGLKTLSAPTLDLTDATFLRLLWFVSSHNPDREIRPKTTIKQVNSDKQKFHFYRLVKKYGKAFLLFHYPQSKEKNIMATLKILISRGILWKISLGWGLRKKFTPLNICLLCWCSFTWKISFQIGWKKNC